MNETQRKLLDIISSVLFANGSSESLTTEIIDEAKIQAVSLLITDDYAILANNIRVISAHEEMTDILKGIPFVTFKGYASASYYFEPIKRAMGDVDLITYSEYYDECIQRLLEAGYYATDKEHERHRSFTKGSVIIELHSEIKGIPNGLDGIPTDTLETEKKIRKLLDTLIETRVAVKSNNRTIFIPDEFHHGLIMLLHVAGHIMNDGGIGLRHLCDWAVYVNHVNFEQYKSVLEDVGLWTFACQLTALSEKYLGLPQQIWSGKWSGDFLGKFMDDILDAGNFGIKEIWRRQSLILKRDSFAGMTKKRYPLADKYPILLLFFMPFYVARFLILLIRGKRKIIKISTLIEAKERDNLYKQFKLFE